MVPEADRSVFFHREVVAAAVLCDGVKRRAVQGREAGGTLRKANRTVASFCNGMNEDFATNCVQHVVHGRGFIEVAFESCRAALLANRKAVSANKKRRFIAPAGR